MALRSFSFAGFLILFLMGAANALVSTENLTPSATQTIYDLKEAIAKGLGFPADDFKISYFDPRDALVGHSVAYEFDIEVDKKVLPFKLLEDVNRWEYVDLPIFRAEDPSKSGDENSLVESRRTKEPVLPVLAPFQLAGPMELWIQDAKDMRLSLPHDVDAGVLKKVILADGAVVTVKGARSVSLRHPLDLPLPLNLTRNGFASGLMMLADGLRFAARTQEAQLLSLRIVGPTSLTSPSSSSSTKTSSPDYKLKLKRLAPGLVELSSPSKTKAIEAISALNVDNEETTLLTPERFTTLWPLASVNGSNPNLLGFEALLSSVLGEKAKEEGSFKLLKAEASAQTFVKMVFGVEKRLKCLLKYVASDDDVITGEVILQNKNIKRHAIPANCNLKCSNDGRNNRLKDATRFHQPTLNSSILKRNRQRQSRQTDLVLHGRSLSVISNHPSIPDQT